MTTEKIGLREKIGYGFGDAASSMFWKIFGMYSLFFYTDVFGITAAAAGTMFLVARLWDSFFDVFVGIMSDRTNPLGKISSILALVCYSFCRDGCYHFLHSRFRTDRQISLRLHNVFVDDDCVFAD